MMDIVELSEKKWLESGSYKKTVLADERKLEQKGNLVQIVSVPPGNRVEPHYHKQTCEFIRVIGGRASFFINDKMLILSTGDMIVTHPGDIHSVENDADEPFEVLVFKTNYVADDSYWLDSG